MIVRYRYRAYPTPAQAQMLARTFGCGRVVYNDAFRQVVKVGRWFPSSRLCSVCGHNDGPKPLEVRCWTCGQCGTEHDRDLNAARNILVEGRKVAAGLADTQNACGGDVRRGAVPAVTSEAGTRRGAA